MKSLDEAIFSLTDKSGEVPIINEKYKYIEEQCMSNPIIQTYCKELLIGLNNQNPIYILMTAMTEGVIIGHIMNEEDSLQ